MPYKAKPWSSSSSAIDLEIIISPNIYASHEKQADYAR